MKALTIWQPWTSLIACKSKRYETRSWPTYYRGLIAIHASKKSPLNIMQLLPAKIQQEIFRTLYDHFNIRGGLLEKLPTGAIIATAELTNCLKIVQSDGIIAWLEDGTVISENEYLFGDYTPGRYAWEIANVKNLPTPIPAKGMQGLWNWKEQS